MIRLRDFLTRRGDPLQLEALTGELGLDRQLPDAEVASPGLALAGYTGRFAPGRLHVLGETEITFLRSMESADRRRRLEVFFGFDLPCIFVTKNQQVPQELLDLAQERSVPVLRSKLKTAEFYRRIKPIVEDAFAPRTTLHGSLADVYGVGLLFVGRSGIGKSECVLDLVERGHRLVADDVVQVTRRGHDVLIGKGHELAAHHMEIRGIGLIDIPALFGVRAVRQQKRIEVIVQLEDWETAKDADRTGLARQETLILEVSVPKVVVPLNPGKNITVISEVVAMNHLLRYSGIDTAAAFNERLIRRMKEKSGIREYLQDDYE
ncbi:MAG TPA: HPr(Ser) kinase/phosphatase [Gemmatimonadales bacterium]|jgi:HPr kinase/phosphorylase|nr:HPr(Ser) kinase/phosphatase [Gemmatimonadales bacterium]